MEINITTKLAELEIELSELNVKIPELRDEKLEISKKLVKKKARREEVVALIKEFKPAI
jgi:seryl-tRNA synthetase